jgi:hypothetical protein
MPKSTRNTVSAILEGGGMGFIEKILGTKIRDPTPPIEFVKVLASRASDLNSRKQLFRFQCALKCHQGTKEVRTWLGLNH